MDNRTITVTRDDKPWGPGYEGSMKNAGTESNIFLNKKPS
jgi:hypothetical protein